MNEMPMATCKDRILAADADFTKTDRKIVGVLLADYPFSSLRTLAETAEASATSTATVLRLVSKLGFDGYPAFQRQIRAEIQDSFQSPLSRFGKASGAGARGSVLGRAVELWVAALHETAEIVTPQEFEQVAQALADEKRAVYLVGGRYSHSLAEVFEYGLSSLRPRVMCFEGTERTFLRVIDSIRPRDVVFLFDFQRYQVELPNFTKRVKALGGTVVLMTDTSRSPCQRVADHVLAVPVESPSPFISSVTTLACLEALIARIAEISGEDGKARLAYIDRFRAGEPPTS